MPYDVPDFMPSRSSYSIPQLPYETGHQNLYSYWLGQVTGVPTLPSVPDFTPFSPSSLPSIEVKDNLRPEIKVDINLPTMPKSGESIGVPDPSVLYCTEHGAKIVSKDSPIGAYNVAVWPDGSECETWLHFRKQCFHYSDDDDDNGDVGSVMSEDQLIKSQLKLISSGEWVEVEGLGLVKLIQIKKGDSFIGAVKRGYLPIMANRNLFKAVANCKLNDKIKTTSRYGFNALIGQDGPLFSEGYSGLHTAFGSGTNFPVLALPKEAR